MRADAPHDAGAARMSTANRLDDAMQIFCTEDRGQRIEPGAERSATLEGLGKVLGSRLRFARRQRVGAHAGEIELFVGEGHGDNVTLKCTIQNAEWIRGSIAIR